MGNLSDQHMREIGRRGGRRGGPSRAKKLSPRRRSAIATEGAIARWGGWKAKRKRKELKGQVAAKRSRKRRTGKELKKAEESAILEC